MGPARVPESPLSGAGSSGRPPQGQLPGLLMVWRPLSRGGLPLPGPLEGRTPVALSPSAAGENRALRGLSSCPSPGRPVRVQPHPHKAHLATTLGSRAWPPRKPKAALKDPQQDLCPWPPDSTHSPGGLSPLAAPPGHQSRGHPEGRTEGSSAQAPRPRAAVHTASAHPGPPLASPQHTSHSPGSTFPSLSPKPQPRPHRDKWLLSQGHGQCDLSTETRRPETPRAATSVSVPAHVVARLPSACASHRDTPGPRAGPPRRSTFSCSGRLGAALGPSDTPVPWPALLPPPRGPPGAQLPASCVLQTTQGKASSAWNAFCC